MKIDQPRENFLDQKHIIDDLEYLLKQPDARELRPCWNCTIPCPCSKSTTCTCNCSADCENIENALSSEPERFPLEPHIKRLSYELNTLRVIQTCWSCEGHTDSHGDVNKLPRIWFYSKSSTYPQLISQYLSERAIKHDLEYHWHITLISYNNGIHNTYALEPMIDNHTSPSLQKLHKDLGSLADNFSADIKRITLKHLNFIQSKMTR